MTPDSTLREFMFAAMMQVYASKAARPGLTGTISLNGNTFDYEFSLTAVYLPPKGDSSSELKN
jgi:hypothetical protein